jgi:putative FmdB family regulatory protein
MPTYSYKCDSCGNEFDVFQSIKDKALTICLICNGVVHRVINGGAGVIFKGSGFYETDYKNKSSSNDNGKHKTASTPKKEDSSDKKDKTYDST